MKCPVCNQKMSVKANISVKEIYLFGKKASLKDIVEQVKNKKYRISGVRHVCKSCRIKIKPAKK